MTWKKGQSGNPLGRQIDRRPKTSAELDVQKYARQFTKEAMDVMVEIMRMDGREGRSDAPPATRLTAADTLIKRGWGAPIQPHSNPDLSPLSFNEMSDEQLSTALARLERAIPNNQGGGSAPTGDRATH